MTLRNVATRLHKLYDRPGLLRLTSRPGHGTTAYLLLPLTPITTGDGLPIRDVALG